MNKKSLSVVMAGAMLATSVAPVLAESTEVKKYEIAASQQGLLKASLRNVMESKKFVSTDTNSTLAGKSIYAISTTNSAPADGDAGDLSKINGRLEAGSKIYVWDLGHREVNGKYYSTSDGTGTETAEKYTLATLEEDFETLMTDVDSPNLNSTYNQIIETAELDKEAGTMKVTFLSVDDEFKKIEKTYKVGEDRADLTKVVSKDGIEYAIGDVKNDGTGKLATSNVAGFATKKEDVPVVGTDIPAKKVAEITLTKEAENSLLVSDLYDGIMLTDKGYEVLAGLKDSYTDTSVATGITVYNKTNSKTPLTSSNVRNIKTLLEPNQNTGVLTIEIAYTDAYGNKHEYTVRGTDAKAAQTLATWLATQDPTVDVLAGENRYETAVAIAKETFGNNFRLISGTANNINNDVVLVNGTALVDGLAAAPYARILGASGAPILLSETDSLPKATKDYLRKLTEKVPASDMDGITIHLVGGESVLSDLVKKELKDMGFTVKRVAGDDREETSIAVAKAIREADTRVQVSQDNAFLVGANGEADAMSIASVASDTTVNHYNKVIPIIVSSVHGLSEDAVEYLASSNVTVVGGTNQISNEEYKALNEANGDKTMSRIAGSNRQATNAAVLKEYYSNMTSMPSRSIVIAKDGQNKKSELVDALAASTLASRAGSPIVLGTTKLSNEQINNIELTTTESGNVTSIYQVGKGVSKDIVKTLVQKFGL